jgi:hypothetical protein
MELWAQATSQCGRRPKNQIRNAVMIFLRRRTPKTEINRSEIPKGEYLWLARQVRFGQVH